MMILEQNMKKYYFPSGATYILYGSVLVDFPFAFHCNIVIFIMEPPGYKSFLKRPHVCWFTRNLLLAVSLFLYVDTQTKLDDSKFDSICIISVQILPRDSRFTVG